MENKSDYHEALDKFVKDYVALDSMIYDGTQEQFGTGTKFQFNLRRYGIHEHTSEMERSNQNPTERVIRELRKKWYQEMFRTYCPRRLWSYIYPYILQDYTIDGQTYWGT